eukprot:jgi/Hompol1/2950/HPOL_003075-RA
MPILISPRTKAIVNGIIRWTARTVVLGFVIVGSGYGIMVATIPSDAQMRARIGHIDVDKMSEDRRNSVKAIQAILDQAKSNRPAYDVQWN